MKILLVSQYFWPETFRINDLALELKQRGHEVSVLTGKPNYPKGSYYKGYRFWGYQKEVYKGINIIRVPLLSRGRGSSIRLILNYLSFIFFSCGYILFHRKKYDASLTFAISPITQVYAALLHKNLHKSRAYIWVQDLWPESVYAAGKANFKSLNRFLNKIVRNIYNKVDGVLVQSEAFTNSILEKGDFSKKITYIPNWAEDIFVNHSSVNKEKFKHLFPSGFKVMFAGNVGEAQDFESIINAAIYTKTNKNIKWIIVGDGRKRQYVEEQLQTNQLNETVFLLGRFPLADMPDLFIHADVMLMTLKKEDIFSLTIPSKMQSYMAFGKPIVSMLDGIGNDIIKKSDCGYTASAENYKDLAINIIKLSETGPNELEKKGLNGYNFYQENFEKNFIIDKIIEILKGDQTEN